MAATRSNTAKRWVLAIAMACMGWAGGTLTSLAAVISAGTRTTTVPTYLSDGSYLFPPGVTVSLGPDQFLLPVEITGAINLQLFQFDVLFDSTVVQQVDPPDPLDPGIYGARFTPGDSNSLSFILGGFPLNFLGLVDDVAGSYPSLINGPTGDGVLAYILSNSCLANRPSIPASASTTR
jgi:hypothetical protein